MKTEEVRAKIYILSAQILMGSVTESEIEAIVKLAGEHNLLHLVESEFHDVQGRITKARELNRFYDPNRE